MTVRDAWFVFAVLGVAAAAAVTLIVGEQAGWAWHGPKPASVHVLGWAALFVAGWTLMTSAMMLPSSIPFLRAVHRLGGWGASSVAGIGYVGIWTLLGALICFVLGLSSSWLAGLGPGTLELLAGATLMAVAAYQVSPLARACQRTCSRPFATLARHWRRVETRERNAWRAGVRYGLSCVGCCMYMVVLMLVVGMSDILWMFALGAVMTLQKRLNVGPQAIATASALLAAGGLAIALGWWSVPLHGLRALCGT